MVQAHQGDYPIERRAGEIERLDIQGDALAADAAVMLDRIGVAEGWRCLDLGCGPGGMTEMLRARVGGSGEAVGLDADAVFLEEARRRARERGLANISYVQGDAYASGLPGGSFDLVHTRFVASTAGKPDVLLREAIRLVRPGAIVAFQEPDMAGLSCYPAHAAWESLKKLLAGVFPSVGGDVRLAQGLFQRMRGAGLEDVQFRPFLVGYRADHAMVDYVPATVESIRGRLLDNGMISGNDLDAVLAACRAHLADPGTVTTYHTMIQVWGRKPAT